jgi:lipopolysaccharide transport system permease protein
MLINIKELVKSRELLLTWALRDFKVRYSQSFLGAAWAILQPLSLMVIFSIIFSFFLKVPTEGIPYPVFAYTALLPWTLFSNSLSFGIPSLVNNMNLVSKIYFPKEILPLSSILVSFIDFLIASTIFIAMLFFYRIQIGSNIFFVPLILFVQLILTFGINLFASAFMVFYRDVRFIVPLALQIWMYICPVIYSVQNVPEVYRPFYFLNPMAVLIDSYRRVILLNTPPDWLYFLLAIFVSGLITLFSYRYFKKAEKKFADLI